MDLNQNNQSSDSSDNSSDISCACATASSAASNVAAAAATKLAGAIGLVGAALSRIVGGLLSVVTYVSLAQLALDALAKAFGFDGFNILETLLGFLQKIIKFFTAFSNTVAAFSNSYKTEMIKAAESTGAFGEELEKAILISDMVLCRSGYSSIMDLSVLKKKALFVPTKGQTEQLYLANHKHNEPKYYPCFLEKI